MSPLTYGFCGSPLKGFRDREDPEALRALMSRRDPNGVKYNFPNTEEGRGKSKAVIKRKIEGNL
ncbi:MAG: hypothetical protein F6K10_28020 [Moorea sp. SIO2B7]|nr:hypothetical protein [Moorena sp. SIO2B7]